MYKANEFGVRNWINSQGEKIDEIKLEDLKGKIKIVFCFQDWCPGCHATGFPSLKTIVDGLKDNKDVVILAIQTVFEGFEANTYDKIRENQLAYNLEIPFGHDAGADNKSQSILMNRFKVGGTPWFILIDKEDNILFEDFRINPKTLVSYINTDKYFK